jgi:hypothetical protein
MNAGGSPAPQLTVHYYAAQQMVLKFDAEGLMTSSPLGSIDEEGPPPLPA